METLQNISLKAVIVAIRRNRAQAHLSQRELANKLCISKKAYNRIENGYTTLSLERFVHIAQILGVTPVDLLQHSSENQRTLAKAS